MYSSRFCCYPSMPSPVRNAQLVSRSPRARLRHSLSPVYPLFLVVNLQITRSVVYSIDGSQTERKRFLVSIRVALRHTSTYHYDQHAVLGPQIVRLKPAAHCRTPIVSYSLKVTPDEHFINWQQDPFGNFQARLVFPESTTKMVIDVSLVADMTVINPFDFFIEEYAEHFPFQYPPDVLRDLKPFLEMSEGGPTFERYLRRIDRTPARMVDFLMNINQKLMQEVGYVIRMEPGVQSPEETLRLGTGSCRDSAWLMVHILRSCGIAARFASGYLIQLAADIKSLDGPSGTEVDFTDLHAWTEAYLPGAGWIGLDPTSGLFAGEGHIPLSCTPDPASAAPISGLISKCEVEFDHAMRVDRVYEDPRVTKPYTEEQWAEIDKLGHAIDERLEAGDVRLTMGGEPTFVSIDDMEGEEWNSSAVGPTKRQLSEKLIRRLRERLAPGGLLHFGQGKWYLQELDHLLSVVEPKITVSLISDKDGHETAGSILAAAMAELNS